MDRDVFCILILGDILIKSIFEADYLLFDQLHDRHRGKLFGDGTELKYRIHRIGDVFVPVASPAACVYTIWSFSQTSTTPSNFTEER